MRLTVDDLPDLSVGAAFLATGGGGDPHVSYLCARQALLRYGPADLIDIADLDDDAAIVAVGNVGAPTTSLELLPSLEDTEMAIRAYRRLTGRPVDAVVSFEIGGGNSLVPLVAGAALGIPVIDGDGMGRALPEAGMMTYALDGVSATPSVALDYRGRATLIDCATIGAYEPIVRDLAMRRGGMITTVEFWMTGRRLKRSIVPGTVWLSIEIGRLLRAGAGDAAQMAGPLGEIFRGSIYGAFSLVASGTVADVRTAVVGGYDIGQAVVEPLGEGQPPIRIDIKNEYLTVRSGERVLASVPDLITILDFETARPINAERLRYGQRISIFAIGCPAHYRTEPALRVVGPRCFGFDFDYTPFEERVGPPSP